MESIRFFFLSFFLMSMCPPSLLPSSFKITYLYFNRQQYPNLRFTLRTPLNSHFAKLLLKSLETQMTSIRKQRSRKNISDYGYFYTGTFSVNLGKMLAFALSVSSLEYFLILLLISLAYTSWLTLQWWQACRCLKMYK